MIHGVGEFRTIKAKPLRIFIGFDSREPVGYHVAAHSILMRASEPVSVTPLRMDTLREQGCYWRGRDEKAATEFSLTRFLVPYLSGYDGWSIFMDSDMLVRADLVGDLKPLLDPSCAVSVCQHDYTPKESTKMDGKAQHAYPRKNWSSFMVFHNAACRNLTPEYVNTATPAQLHRFQWVEAEYGKDRAIGSLPLAWNWLVGEYDKNPDAKILHYTDGLPCFLDYQFCDHADLWWKEYHAMINPVSNGPFSREAWMRHMESAA